MKAYVRFIIVVSLLVGNALRVVAQNLEPFSPYGMINPSVQSFKMARYGQESPSLYNGSMACSVPVYTYSDPDFTIPISLDYHFDGFRPSEDSGFIGYGWILNCGGVITREVRGLPDDCLPNNKNGNFKKGFLLLPKNRSYRITSQTNLMLVPYSETSIPNQLICKMNPFKLSPFFNLYSQEDTYLYDTESDIYHYSFLGHHGSFYINESGTVTVSESDLPVDNLTVSITSPCYDIDGIASVDFQITTSDGYKYIFKPLEISVSLNEYDLIEEFYEIPKSYTGYRLVQIIAPNGRAVEFQYKTGSLQTSFTIDKHYSTITNFECDYGSPSQNVYSLNGAAILESIKVDGKNVTTFDYITPESLGEKGDNCYHFIADCGSRIKNQYRGQGMMEKVVHLTNYGKVPENLQLSGVFAFNADRDTVSRTTFNYQYTAGTPKRLLSSVNTDGGIYSFQYKTDISLPANDTQSTDHWGYLNAWPSTQRVYLDAIINQNNLHTGDRYNQFRAAYAEWKLPSFSKALACALTKITFPTGGWTAIEYEGNMAGKRINGLVPSLEDCQDCSVGGVRVKKISNYSVQGNMIDYNLYRYCLQEGGSSGILQTMPVYAIETYHKYVDPKNYLIPQPEYVSWLDVHTYAYMNSCSAARAKDGHIAYSSVSVEHADGSIEEYKFSSYKEYPDTYEDFEIKSTKLTPDADMYKNVFYYHDSIEPNDRIYFLNSSPENISAVPIICPPSTDRSGCRGKIKEKVLYDKYGKTVKYENFTYNEANYVMGNPIHDYVYKFKKCVSALRWLYLKSRTETVYDSGKGLSKRWEYGYNHGGQIISEKITSPTDIVTTSYKYNND